MAEELLAMGGSFLVDRMLRCGFGNEVGLIPKLHWTATQMLYGQFAFYLELLLQCLETRASIMVDRIG